MLNDGAQFHPRVLVTGAGGFIGKELVRVLIAKGGFVCATSRRAPEVLPRSDNPRWITTEDLAEQRNETMFDGVDVVVHLAGRAHILKETAANPATEYWRTNAYATECLARAAAERGVHRFVYVSSIGVNGNTTRGQAFTENTPVAPHNYYAVSKWEGETLLHKIAQETGLEVVILRPPLVYGPGVGANFLRLLRLVERGIPLPFGAVNNRRSLLSLGNLVDAIALCISHPAAANRTYLVSDGEDISTPELIRRLAAQMGKRARLLPMPVRGLELVGRFVGKEAEVQRLVGGLVVDSSRIRRELGWQPPYSLDEGLVETARWYLRERQRGGI